MTARLRDAPREAAGPGTTVTLTADQLTDLMAAAWQSGHAAATAAQGRPSLRVIKGGAE